MLIRSPKLAACALSIVPIVAAVNKVYGDWLSRNSRKVQDALAAANSVAQETFSCVRTVIAFAAEQLEYDKYVERIDEQYRLNVKQTYMTGIYFMFICTFLINTVVQGTLLLVGSYMMQHGNLTGEVLLAFMLYQGQLQVCNFTFLTCTGRMAWITAHRIAKLWQNEMMNLFNSYSSLIKSSGAGDKVFGLLDRSPPAPATGSPAVENAGSPASISDNAVSIKLDDISFSYPSRPQHAVLKGLSLAIPAGQTIALVGRSGCGKSTVVGLLQRFYDPTSGRVFFDEIDLRQLDIKVHRYVLYTLTRTQGNKLASAWMYLTEISSFCSLNIGAVTQEPVLLSGTILSNITYGTPGATMEQAVEAARMANAHDFISSFPHGYETEVGERGVQLSGGQKQRIAISRAIIRHPSLLLLDEATSGKQRFAQVRIFSFVDLISYSCFPTKSARCRFRRDCAGGSGQPSQPK